ncbi:MAG TPA: hypothetical protein PLS50_05655, partial [Candidatus Dojkabacteria bacterium]|nr:hypothetical protein [Candidatus Dojkabacteria bacterium]
MATFFGVHRKRAKLWLKVYLTILIKEGHKRGLNINFSKCAILEMFTSKTNYDYLSDTSTSWTKGKG